MQRMDMRSIQADRREPRVIKGIWHIPSFSSRRKQYHVRYSGIHGRWCCDCKDWQFRRQYDHTDCKHVAQVKEILDTWSIEELEEIEYEH